MTRRLKLARRFSDRKPRRVTFTKKNGEVRTMTFRYEGGAIAGALMTVWDLDKNAYRRVNLDTITGPGFVLHEAKKGFNEIKQHVHSLLF